MSPGTERETGPRRLGDFEVLRELGRGGMGVVYEARQVSLNRKVALKVLATGLGMTTRAVERFQREAEAAAKLHHSNIVPVYATGEQDGTYYYAMELIDGPSLDLVIRQLGQATHPQPQSSDTPSPSHALTELYIGSTPAMGTHEKISPSSLGSGSGYFDTVARMIAEVADALEHAHQQGVLHRDIKPSNLLLSSTGRLSVNDFGLARMLEQPGMTMTGEFVGTPAYMSPEQITAGRIPIDRRTDIYSLGATLYELLTLQPPFTGERRDQLLAQILQKEAIAPRKVNRSVPVDLETICLKALEKDPDRRYQTAAAMAEDLRRYVNRYAIVARRATLLTRLNKWVRRHPALTTALAGVFFALAAAGFFAYQSHHLARQVVAQRRQAAMEAALGAAMRGEVDEADKAVAEAKRWEASQGQVWFLLGMLAYYQGKELDAVRLLEQAVEQLPRAESAGARGLLVLAYIAVGRGNDVDRGLTELEQIVPVTLIDQLFQGAAISQWDASRGLQLLDEAVKGNPSSAVARLLRAGARIAVAQDRGDPQIADQAVEDVSLAKSLLPKGNPTALCDFAWTHAVASGVYGYAGMKEKQQAALAQANREAEELKLFLPLPIAVSTRINIAWINGQKVGFLGESRPSARLTGYPNIAWYHALGLYWRRGPGDLEEARDVLQHHPSNPQCHLILCCVLADLENRDAALKILQQRVGATGEILHKIRTYIVLYLLGRKDLAKAESKKDRARTFPSPPIRTRFFQKVLAFVGEDLPAEGLLQAAGEPHSNWNLGMANQFIGLKHLAEGNRGEARRSFEQALTTRHYGNLAHDLCQVFVERMKKDEAWPRWIPLKQK